MGSPINWAVRDGDTSLLQSDLYLKYSSQRFATIDANTVKTDIGVALASNESAAVVAYLSWVLRTVNLLA